MNSVCESCKHIRARTPKDKKVEAGYDLARHWCAKNDMPTLLGALRCGGTDYEVWKPSGVLITYGRGKKCRQIYVEGGKLFFRAKDLGRLNVLVSGTPMTRVENEKEAYVREDYAVEVLPELAADLPEIRANVLRQEQEYRGKTAFKKPL